MSKVDRIVTPWSETLLGTALRDSHVRVFGGPPTMNRWKCAWGHLGLEQGRGKRTNNNNAGNVTAGKAWKLSSDYFTLKVPPPDPAQLDFRSLPDAITGCDGYWRLMAGRYARALSKMDQGDPLGACVVMSEMKYFLADLGPYAKAVVSLSKYAETNVLPPLFVDARPGLYCESPDCDGEMRSLVTEAEIAEIMGEGGVVAWDLAGEALDEDRARRRTIPD
jgi:hypothetical protein